MLRPEGIAPATGLSAADLEFGNAAGLDTEGSGWIIGFSDWTKGPGDAGLRHMPFDQHASGLCVKWFMHPPGQPNGEAKPLSEGRTISLLAGQTGAFRLDFSRSPAFDPERTATTVLRSQGDFAIWGAGLYHRAFALKASCIVTVRWQPEATRTGRL